MRKNEERNRGGCFLNPNRGKSGVALHSQPLSKSGPTSNQEGSLVQMQGFELILTYGDATSDMLAYHVAASLCAGMLVDSWYPRLGHRGVSHRGDTYVKSWTNVNVTHKCEGYADCFLQMQWRGVSWILATSSYDQ